MKQILIPIWAFWIGLGAWRWALVPAFFLWTYGKMFIPEEKSIVVLHKYSDGVLLAVGNDVWKVTGTFVSKVGELQITWGNANSVSHQSNVIMCVMAFVIGASASTLWKIVRKQKV